MNGDVKPVRYDDNAVTYGLNQPQTQEVASGVITSVGGGLLVGGMVKGLGSYALVAGNLRLTFEGTHPLPYQAWVQFNNAVALPAVTMIHRVVRAAGYCDIQCATPAGVAVDLSTIAFEVWFSIKTAA